MRGFKFMALMIAPMRAPEGSSSGDDANVASPKKRVASDGARAAQNDRASNKGANGANGANGGKGKAHKAAAGGGASDPEITIIRKYANRRLYDTKRSRYVTLDELAQQIRDGTRCEVRDAVSGEDLTRTVLTQIILGEGCQGKALLPESFLHNIIAMCGGEHNRALFPTYLDMTMDAFVHQREVWAKMFGLPAGAASGDNSPDSAPGNGSVGGNGSMAGNGGVAGGKANGHAPAGSNVPSGGQAYGSPYALMQQQVNSNVAMFRQWMGTVAPSHEEISSNGAAAGRSPAPPDQQMQDSRAATVRDGARPSDAGGRSPSEAGGAGGAGGEIAELRALLSSLQRQVHDLKSDPQQSTQNGSESTDK